MEKYEKYCIGKNNDYWKIETIETNPMKKEKNQ